MTGGTVESSGSYAIYIASQTDVIIAGGTVKNTGAGNAIYNYSSGSVSVTAGTVSSGSGAAIYSNSQGKISISGTAEIISAATSGTISLNYNVSPYTILEISGGTITNTSSSGYAIKAGNSKFSITGGTSVIKSNYKVMDKAPELTGFDFVRITASQDYSGTPEGIYDIGSFPATAISYKYLKLEVNPAYEAKIGTTGYATLQEAINEVEDTGTIQLLKDLSLTDTVTITEGADKSFILDLNGKTLSGNSSSAIKHMGSGILTIEDNIGGGKVTSARTDYDKGTITLEGGGLVVTGGIVENTAEAGNAIYNKSIGSVSISGGVIQSSGNEGCAIFNASTGMISISGTALITSANAAGEIYGTIYLSVGIPHKTILEITGGTVENTSASEPSQSYGIYNNSDGDISISGGLINAISGMAIYCDNGSILIPGGSPVIKGRNQAVNKAPDFTGYTNAIVTASLDYQGAFYTYDSSLINSYKHIKVAGAEAKINGTLYYTLQQAFYAVTNGQTITLLADVNLATKITVTNDNNFTLNLNGKTINNNKGSVFNKIGTGLLTIQDTVGTGKITGDYGGGDGGTISLKGGSLELAGGFVENRNSLNGCDVIYSISTGNVSVTGGTVSSVGIGIGNHSTGTVSITGGTISCYTGIENNSTGKVNIAGGTINCSWQGLYNYSTGTVNVTGGTVDSEASAIYNQGTGTITVGGDAVLTGKGSSDGSTIYLNSTSSGKTVLNMTGGTVENTGTGYAIYMKGSGNMSISGGMMSAADGTAIYVASTGKILIPSGSPVIKGSSGAMNIAPDLSSYTYVKITANTEPEEAGAYAITKADLTANPSNYTYVKLEPASTTPAASIATVAKKEPIQQEISFQLTTAPVGTYKVYSDNTTVTEHTTVSAILNDKTLTLTDSSGDIAVGTYYISVTESDKAESARLALTVSAYVPAAPEISSITISSAGSTYKIGASLTIAVEFDRTVIVERTPRLELELDSGTVYADYVSGSKSTLLFSYTVQSGDSAPHGISIKALQANGGSIKESAGLIEALPALNNVQDTTGVLIDGVAPTVDITSAAAGSTSSTPIQITITFSENMTGFTEEDITVTNGTISSFNQTSAAVYSVMILPIAEGT